MEIGRLVDPGELAKLVANRYGFGDVTHDR